MKELEDHIKSFKKEREDFFKEMRKDAEDKFEGDTLAKVLEDIKNLKETDKSLEKALNTKLKHL